MNTRSIQRALNGGVSGTHNGAEFSRGMYILSVCVCVCVCSGQHALCNFHSIKGKGLCVH